MIKEHRRSFKVIRIFFDTVLVLGFYYFLLWFTLRVANPLRMPVFLNPDYLRLPALLAVLWMVSFILGGWYEQTRRAGFFSAWWISLKAVAFMMVLFSLAVFLFKIQFVSRKFFSVYVAGCVALLCASRIMEYRLLAALRRLGFNTLSVLLVGRSQSLGPVAEEFSRNQEWGYRVLGLVSLDPVRTRTRGVKTTGFRTLGHLEGLEKILRDRVVDELVLAAPIGDEAVLEKVLDVAASAGVSVRLAMHAGMAPWNMQMDRLGSLPALVFSPHGHGPYRRMVKMAVDFLGAAAALILLLPLFALIGAAILVTSGRPVLFRQKRIGLHGRAFYLYKFRTMVLDARKKQGDLMAENEMSGPVFKIRNDPRVTRVGAVLRKWSLDELPQFLNVLRGEVSLVGPRPLPFVEARKVPAWARRRYSVKPGLTCYWQVMGRNHIGFEEWMRLDLKYVDEWSLWLDLRLLVRTPFAVLAGRGAY